MRRLVGVLTAVALLTMPSLALAGQGGAKTMTARGTVSAVTTDSLTVKGAEEMKFMITKDTTVIAKGATHKTLALKAEEKSARLTDFVSVKDQVTVTYTDVGGMHHASQINVTAQAVK